MSYIRGSRVSISTTFLDEDGNATTVASAQIALRYKALDGTRATDTIDLSLNDGAWCAVWDSSVARPGLVYWSVRGVAESGAPTVDDGEFSLEANPANGWDE